MSSDRAGAEFLKSAVNLYCNPSLLDRDIAALQDAGYRILTVDASSWMGVADMHQDLATVFGFPAHYGQNWAALNDCLSDVRAADWDLSTGALRVVLALRRFDVFTTKFPSEAHFLLDIYAVNQREALIDGDHLLCLVQSDDPRLQLAPVGPTTALWNRDEWLERNRGLSAPSSNDGHRLSATNLVAGQPHRKVNKSFCQGGSIETWHHPIGSRSSPASRSATTGPLRND